MAIIQGTNNPLVFDFGESMDTIIDIEISLYSEDDTELKHWTIGEVEIDEGTISAPLEQRESLSFPPGPCYIEIKWTDAFGKTNFAKTIKNTVKQRKDKIILNEVR